VFVGGLGVPDDVKRVIVFFYFWVCVREEVVEKIEDLANSKHFTEDKCLNNLYLDLTVAA
jgi:hypothetical protein